MRKAILGTLAGMLLLTGTACQESIYAETSVSAGPVVVYFDFTPTPETVAFAEINTPIPEIVEMTVPRVADTATPRVTITPTPEPTAVVTAAPTAEATAAPTAAATAQPTKAPTATPTPKPAATPSPTPRPTEAPTEKPTAAPTQTPSPAPTEEPTAAPEATATPDSGTSSAAPTPIVSESLSTGVYNDEELELAARVAYWEARGGGEEGYRAVLCVILNRCESSKYGGGLTTIFTEVYRKSQFSVVRYEKFASDRAPSEIIEYARDVFNNKNRLLPDNVLSFRSGSLGTSWGDRTYYGTYGGNAFFTS